MNNIQTTINETNSIYVKNEIDDTKFIQTIINETKFIYEVETNYIENPDEVLKDVQEILNKEFNTSDIDNGKDFIQKNGKMTFTITSTSNQKNNKKKNVTTINLGECETKLKEEYNISINDSLYILKIDVEVDNMKKVEYEVYYPFSTNNLTKLNLSVCKNIKIDISIPKDINLDEISKYNMSSDIYNEICNSLINENGIDKPLKARQNEFVNNDMSICEEDCEFTSYDNETKNAICSCYTKINLPTLSEIKVDKEKMFSNFKDIKNIANIKMLTCSHLLFDKKNIFKNSANYMLLILFILSIISIFVFIYYNYKRIKKFINNIIIENNFNDNK